jgi:hypothetical protein
MKEKIFYFSETEFETDLKLNGYIFKFSNLFI